MQTAKACHHVRPIKLPATMSPSKLLPPTYNPSQLKPTISRAAISITAPTPTTTQPTVQQETTTTVDAPDDAVLALRDYRSLFVSQRAETTEPISLRLVDGALPHDFPSGTYYLTGPGMFSDDYGSTVHPLDGHGYLRAFRIHGGGARGGRVEFTARYVETEAQTEERDPATGQWRFTHRGPFSVLKGGRMVGNTKVMKNVANTSVLRWGERLFCLWEGGDPYEIDVKTLGTLGKFNIADIDRNMMSENDDDGERLFRANFLDLAAKILEPILYEFDPNFKLLQSQEFSIPDHLMIHDWAFTDSHYILFGNRIKLDVAGSMGAVCGLSPMISALSLNPSKPTSPIYLLPRFPNSLQPNRSLLRNWRIPIEAPSQMWVLHVANAFEERDVDGNLDIRIQASSCSYHWFNFQKMFGYDWRSGKLDPSMMNLRQGEEELLPHLIQVNITLDGHGNCRKCHVNNLNKWSKPSDFPVINQNLSGTKNTYIYAATSSGSRRALPHFPFDTVAKLNTIDKPTQTWSTGRRRFIGEPIFIAKDDKGEDDGYLLVIEYAVSIERCYLVVLDSKLIGKENAIVARFEVPTHLNFPLGFHGFWAPNNSYSSVYSSVPRPNLESAFASMAYI
ncbi:Carotenoid cleavage dioxygenase 7, chloroplastic [Orobanche hederae]